MILATQPPSPPPEKVKKFGGVFWRVSFLKYAGLVCEL